MNAAGETARDPAAVTARIVVAIDFSEDAHAALLWACRYAECRAAELVLLHVVHDPAASPGFYRKTPDSLFRPMHAVAESMMAEFLERFVERHPTFGHLTELAPYFVPGLPPTRIVEVAELLEAGLVVVGSRGQTGLPHRLIGSTSERVVELAPMPVVVVKSDEFGKLDKKARKRREKRLRKDEKKLRKILGIEHPEVAHDVDD
ncbi:MAG: universal stress protein [Xanthomonadales bacterium]